MKLSELIEKNGICGSCSGLERCKYGHVEPDKLLDAIKNLESGRDIYLNTFAEFVIRRCNAGNNFMLPTGGKAYLEDVAKMMVAEFSSERRFASPSVCDPNTMS